MLVRKFEPINHGKSRTNKPSKIRKLLTVWQNHQPVTANQTNSWIQWIAMENKVEKSEHSSVRHCNHQSIIDSTNMKWNAAIVNLSKKSWLKRLLSSRIWRKQHHRLTSIVSHRHPCSVSPSMHRIASIVSPFMHRIASIVSPVS